MMHPPFVAPGSPPAARNVDALPSIQEFLDELPSIEDFVDHTSLPPIADFVADEPIVEASQNARDADWFQQEEYDADGWAAAGWQDFDWTGTAALGARADDDAEASSAWDMSEWNTDANGAGEPSREGHAPPSADEVAAALDGIARRIRSGELVIDQLSGTPPEAAMAAALATLLRMRD
jgi:hypothetical protein